MFKAVGAVFGRITLVLDDATNIGVGLKMCGQVSYRDAYV